MNELRRASNINIHPVMQAKLRGIQASQSASDVIITLSSKLILELIIGTTDKVVN